MMNLATPMLDDTPLSGTEELFAERVRNFVAEWCGYAPRPAAMQHFREVLARRRGDRTHEEYWQILQRSVLADGEMQLLVEDLLNHSTVCGRTPPHFDALRRRVLPALAASGRTLRLVSLGCSTGEEVYTLALAAVEVFGIVDEPRIEIVGLDLSRRALAVAKTGVYTSPSLRELTPAQREYGFIRQGDKFTVRPEISRIVRFAQHNIMTPLPLVGVDAIFCRNVLIYFSTAATNVVHGHIRNALVPGGWLFLGPTESAPYPRESFESVAFAETRIYRRR